MTDVRVLMATAELAPLVRVGGLAEAVSGLVKALRADGLEVTVALPDYAGAPLEAETVQTLDVPEWIGPTAARTGHLDGFGSVTLIDLPRLARPHPYMRPDGLFGWDDNDQRFIGFSIAVAALAEAVEADVVHANDWHTAATFAFLPPSVHTVFGLHNLAYQGECDAGWTEVFPHHAGAVLRQGVCNPMAGALTVADRVVAVSPTYASEITTYEHGAGLDDLLRQRGSDLSGIRNGIDASEWSPIADQLIASSYAIGDFSVSNPVGKTACTASVRARFALPRSTGPLIAMVTRLVHQKGIDLVEAMMPFLKSIDAQLVILGSGDPTVAAAVRLAADADPDRVAFFDGYDIALSHQLFAGADLYLMPSRFEPCGLAQMQAMAYGTIPVVTDVGGLHDTVTDADHDALGNGFVAYRVDAVGVLDALHRAARAWKDRRRRTQIIRRGMRADWSWTEPARAYRTLYEALV